MESENKSLKDHVELLGEQGYLGAEFKGEKSGYWLRELQERFNECQFNAIGNSAPGLFSIELAGEFNARLDRVHFKFNYKYDPLNDSLSLLTVQTGLGGARKVYLINEFQPLPVASEVYAFLSKKATRTRSYDLMRNMKNDLRYQEWKRKGRFFLK